MVFVVVIKSLQFWSLASFRMTLQAWLEISTRYEFDRVSGFPPARTFPIRNVFGPIAGVETDPTRTFTFPARDRDGDISAKSVQQHIGAGIGENLAGAGDRRNSATVVGRSGKRSAALNRWAIRRRRPANLAPRVHDGKPCTRTGSAAPAAFMEGDSHGGVELRSWRRWAWWRSRTLISGAPQHPALRRDIGRVLMAANLASRNRLGWGGSPRWLTTDDRRSAFANRSHAESHGASPATALPGRSAPVWS
jgi:hypothetical protein